MEWISVDDRLPDGFQSVIGHLKNGTITEVMFTDIGNPHWFKVGISTIHDDNPVTYWQQMPTPPGK